MKRFASSESTATELVPMWTVPLSLFQTDQCPVENRKVELKTCPSWCDTHLVLRPDGGCCSGDGQQGETDEFGADCWPTWNSCQEQWQHGQQQRQEESSWDAEGNCYIGTWLNGLKHGLGTMWHCGGDISSGEWKLGHQSGRGWKVYAAANDYYVGEFMNGKRSGTGFYMWSNEDQYFGEWKDGAACGVGTKQMSNGSVYTGSWSAGMANGYGIKIFSDGSRYEGSFLQDRRQGFGKYTWSHNEWVEGYWANGALHGDATHHYTSGAVFKGQWKAGKKHGLGLLTMSNRSFHQTWKDGHCTVHEETRFLPPRLMSQTNEHALPASYLSLSQEVARLERAREEKDNIEDRCLVCCQNHITAVLDPCGHLCVCLECSTALDLCPICRAHVRRVIRVFRA